MRDKAEDKEIEWAIEFMARALAGADAGEKPKILHSVRVGMYLYNHDYGREIVQAAFLHDMVESAGTSLKDIRERFGEGVARLVAANSDDETISDKTERYRELFGRGLQEGEDALLIKAADLLDNSHAWKAEEDGEKREWQMEKIRYFLWLSTEVLREHPVWEELKGQVEA